MLNNEVGRRFSIGSNLSTPILDTSAHAIPAQGSLEQAETNQLVNQ
jgi:hypothetical protein